MAEPIDIAGSVSVVTGGASGIGKGIVKALLNNGGTVVVADIEEQPIQETVAEFKEFGPVEGYVTDVSNEGSVEDLSQYVFDKYEKCNLSLIMQELVQAVEEKRGRTNLTIGNGALALMFSDQLMELSHLFQK